MPFALLRPVRCAAALAACLLLAGCGDDEPAEPSPAATPATASGALSGAQPVLTRLREQVRAGRGGPGLHQDVATLRNLLWPSLDTPEAQQASEAHVTLVHTAGSVAQTIALPPAARAQVGAIDEISLEIHERWLEASASPPAEYARWCSHEGVVLVRRLQADRARLFDPAREGAR